MAFKIIDNELQRCQVWVANNYDVVGSDLVVTIGLENNGVLIAVVGFNQFNGRSAFVHFYMSKAVFVPSKYVWFIHYYAFVQSGLSMLIAAMDSKNEKILRLASHVGYIEKYRLSNASPTGDVVICTLNKNDCKYLGASNGI